MSWINGELAIKLLIASSFCLILLLLILLAVSVASKKRRYYRRVGFDLSHRKSTLEGAVISLWDVVKILLLVILIVILAFFAIRFISQSNWLGDQEGSSENIVVTNFSEEKNATGTIAEPLPAKGALSGYWGYIIAGFVLLLIIVLLLKRKETEEYY